MAVSATHDPESLYRASLERVEAARNALKAGDSVMCIYLGGLAVECLLQAVVHLDTQQHDARHDLIVWLRRSRKSLQDAMRSDKIRASWSHVVAIWRNDFRYYSESSLYGVLRKMGRTKRLKGDPTSVLRQVAKRFLASVVSVHNQGIAAWANYTTR